MHQPGESGMQAGSSTSLEGKETWSQFSAKVRHGRRRIRVTDITAKMSFEYSMLKKLCRRRPAMRQWMVRDDFCDMSPGVVVMSPSMQAAFMKVFRLKDKGLIRQCLRDIIPIIEYRNREEQAAAMRPSSAAALIPEGEPDALNQKKRELFERKEVGLNMKPMYLHDHRSQAKLRFKIRQRLIKFQRQLAVANAVSSRSVLYSTDDAIGYFLFRGAAMYAGMHRVFFEVSKLLPHFVPKTMLDFGAGTGTAILVAKEVYDPASLAYPLYRSLRQTMTLNEGAEGHRLQELKYDLKRLQRNNHVKKKARFMAVAALLERGEVDGADLPLDLRQEIATVAARAAEAKKLRLRTESHARHRDVVDGSEWDDGDPLQEKEATREDPEERWVGEEADEDGQGELQEEDGSHTKRTWWEELVDLEVDSAESKAKKRLRPLQEITAIEPSPGMMEIGTMVLHNDVPHVTWKRYLLPEDETIQQDLVVAAYSLSEIGDPQHRKRIVQQLWKMTRGVLVLVEFANLSNFDLLMEARDTILEEKGVGLWDWQPTIVGPCPHEDRCPLRHCKAGVKRQRMRICSTEAQYKATFIEVWARQLPLKVGIEPISYLVFARNELVPERAEKRRLQVEKEKQAAQKERDEKQQELYDAALSIGDVVQERVSDEALHRPHTGAPPKLTADGLPATVSELSLGKKPVSGESGMIHKEDSTAQLSSGSSDEPLMVSISNSHQNKLIYPKHSAPATHRFNRAFIDADYQRQRAITPSEMLVVREEASRLRKKVGEAAHKYLRIVRDPKCHGKIQADFCTPQGELITGRVYRRYYGDTRKGTPRHSTLRWQHIGGWKLLKRVRSGSLFPHDVPMYAITTHPQVDFPNTLLNTKQSTIAKTAMQFNDPLTPPNTENSSPNEPVSREDQIKLRKAEQHKDQMEKVESLMERMFGSKVAKDQQASLSRVDAQREISAEEWVRAVQKAKRATVEQTKRVIPFAAKMRAQRRSFLVRKRNPHLEQKSNRRR